MNIQKMMAQAQAMQSRMQQELEALRIEASSGGGMVCVEMSGTKEILSSKIDPACVDPKDVETLEDLMLAACREAAGGGARYSKHPPDQRECLPPSAPRRRRSMRGVPRAFERLATELQRLP